MTVVFVSLCPQEELDIETFVASRPGLSTRFALLPLITGGMRALEFPFPRWISILVAIAWLLQGCVGCSCCIRCDCGRKARRYLRMLSFVDLMQLWYLDVTLSSAINEAAMDEPGIWTSVWLLVHAAFAISIVLWLRWRSHLQNTATFYVASYLSLSWNSSYFACRAIDLALGHKEWEEGRQVDIAIVAAMSFAFLILFPMLFAIWVGQRRLFHKLATWLEHSRSRRLQDGAFMAMLLDSYVVEVGQPWWLTEKEAAQGNIKVKAAPKEDLLRASRSSISVEMPHQHEPRPGFVAGVVVAASGDALSFVVECQVDAGTVKVVEVERGQDVFAWPELLKMGRKNLRCVDWAALSPELLRQNSPSFSDFRLSRPVSRGEVIDFFVSHSWSDSPAQKWRAMQLVVEQFYRKNGRYPTFWIDKFCIDQSEIADGLRVLPVNVMSCRKMLCLSGKTYHNRLWCAWELCVLLSFMSMEMALKQIVVVALSQSALMELTGFDCSKARCYNPNEEFRLRRVIEAIGKHRFEIKIRALGQLLLDRDVNGGGLLTAGSGTMSFAFSSEGSAPRRPSRIFADRVEEPVEPVEPKEPEEPEELEDPMVEVAF